MSSFFNRLLGSGQSDQPLEPLSASPSPATQAPAPRSDAVKRYLDRTPAVLMYRRAYYETFGTVAPGEGLPSARTWPPDRRRLSYSEKLMALLPADGRGAEIGALNKPTLTKARFPGLLYVDHLETEALRAKYQGLPGIVEVDRPMPDGRLTSALGRDTPLDFLCASQVFEHVPDPIGWMRDAADVLKPGGLLSMSLPDRRLTFDLYREETRAADMVAAHLAGAQVPDVRAVYDNQALAAAVNVTFIRDDSISPEQVVAGGGAVIAPFISDDPMPLTEAAQGGEYLDTHCWVFTPPGFLLVMAQLARHGFVPFLCKQFWPTTRAKIDRSWESFTAVLEKPTADVTREEIARSYLMALGEDATMVVSPAAT